VSFFLVVPGEGRGEPADQLARRVGAAPLSEGRALEVLARFAGEAGGPPFSFGHWRVLEVPDGDPDSELREIAAALSLEVELVAIVRRPGAKPCQP
jgi:hypothetical protein